MIEFIYGGAALAAVCFAFLGGVIVGGYYVAASLALLSNAGLAISNKLLTLNIDNGTYAVAHDGTTKGVARALTEAVRAYAASVKRGANVG